MKLYTTIINIGVQATDSARFTKKIQLINQIGLLATISTFLLMSHLYLIHDYYYIPIQLIATLALSTCFVFSKMRLFYTSFYWVFTLVIANVFYRSIEAPNSGIEYFLIPISLIPVVVLESKTKGVALIFVAITTFWASFYVKEFYTPHYVLSQFDNNLTYVILLNVVFLLSTLVLFQFKLININYEQIIGKQKTDLEHKNKEITDSINYAKRIQNANLPNKNEVYKALLNSFILFKPKDIVSGDFYYFKQKDNLLFIAAADCTGHGVPGAFMSFVCSEKLDAALAHTTNVAKILSSTNRGVKAALNQTDANESTRDGMDIALCSIDLATNTISYAGANRPIWIIRNNTTEVEEIKATKTALGGLTSHEQVFDLHQFKLNTGDAFYIFSDGYADTFNGLTNKKLTTKAFKQLLLTMQQHPMVEQEQLLNTYINNWKGNAEQIDDILVIGVYM
ncbi:MAG: SpoIIE family protein phosphatase [Bacteroidia bacterium]|nr:SpoIIE family protein phosphatase [Bacteroidia bacterium]